MQVPFLLDGSMGDELNRRGENTAFPLWSTAPLLHNPAVILELHQDYLQAGATVLTANTFRTNVRTLTKAGIADQGAFLNQKAISLARKAWGEQKGWVAASIAPVEDCYSPELVPSDKELEEEHELFIQQLAAAEPDFLLIETMNCIREAQIALKHAQQTKIPVWLSFMVTEKLTLPSGEKLSDAYNAVLPFEPEMILANCFPLQIFSAVLATLKQFHFPFGLYPNAGHFHKSTGYWTRPKEEEKQIYAKAMQESLQHGASLVGGCCGTTPSFIEAIAKTIS